MVRTAGPRMLPAFANTLHILVGRNAGAISGVLAIASMDGLNAVPGAMLRIATRFHRLQTSLRGGFDAIDALQAARQQRATCGAIAAVFDEVVPFQDQLALARVQGHFAPAFDDDRNARNAFAFRELRLRD